MFRCIPGKLLLATFLAVIQIGVPASATSWSEDWSRYVLLSPHHGYYVVKPDGALYRKLGLWETPWIDTSDRLRHGYGADALAFRFNRKGVLMAPPAYIVQALENDFYKRKIGRLVRGRTTAGDVEALFGRGHSTANRPDGFIYYYALPVYNPFEDWGGGRR